MRLVNDKQDAPAVALLGEHEVGDPLQKCALRQPLLGDAKPGRDEMQKIIPGELGGDNLGDHEVALINRRQQVIDENCFAGTDLSGNNDETVGVVQPIYKIRHRLPMHRALVKEAGVGRKLKRRCRQPVEIFVHLR